MGWAQGPCRPPSPRLTCCACGGRWGPSPPGLRLPDAPGCSSWDPPCGFVELGSDERTGWGAGPVGLGWPSATGGSAQSRVSAWPSRPLSGVSAHFRALTRPLVTGGPALLGPGSGSQCGPLSPQGPLPAGPALRTRNRRKPQAGSPAAERGPWEPCA